MKLTSDRRTRSIAFPLRSRLTGPWVLPAVMAALLLIFQLDRVTASAPVQHLYYLPIMLASLRFGRSGGLSASMAAVLLYHLATPTLVTWDYKESDLVQIALFVAVGIVTAKLADDARRLHSLAATDDLTGLHNLRSFEAQPEPDGPCVARIGRSARHARARRGPVEVDQRHLWASCRRRSGA